MAENQRELDPNALFQALTEQRNTAQNEAAQARALLMMADARVAVLERELATLRERMPPPDPDDSHALPLVHRH